MRDVSDGGNHSAISVIREPICGHPPAPWAAAGAPNLLEVHKQGRLDAGSTAMPLKEACLGVEDGVVVEHLISDSF